jgi:hypothetical protein
MSGTRSRQVHWTRRVVVLQGQLPLRIRPRARAEVGYSLGSYDFGGYAAPALRAAGLVRQGLPDDGKGRALRPDFLNNAVTSRQPLPGPGIR